MKEPLDIHETQPEQKPVRYVDVFNVLTPNGVKTIASKPYTKSPKRKWVGLTVNEARGFYEKYTDKEELIYAIDKFLEEKNT